MAIPQPDGTTAPIKIYDVSDTKKMLGLHYAPICHPSWHVKVVMKTGEDWTDKLITHPLPRKDTWMSFEHHILPAMPWGLVAVGMSFEKLEAKI